MKDIKAVYGMLASTVIALVISVGVNIYQTNLLADAGEKLGVCNEYFSALLEDERRQEEVRQELERYNVPSKKSSKLVPIILESAIQYNVDTRLLIAQIFAESNFKTLAHSDAGARGLMQVMPFWTRVKHFQNNTGITRSSELYTMEGSIRAGAYILSHYISRCGGLQEGLSCYNGGPRALKYPKPETTGYVTKVMKHYNRMLV